jgi:hypothetical protein
MSDQQMNPVQAPSRRTLLIATLVSLVVAAIVLVTAVLPAEYGIDPLGTGQALGLTQLAQTSELDAVVAEAQADAAIALEPVRPGANTPQPASFKRDSVEFELGPFEGIEYKYRVDQKGGAFVYAWTSTGPVKYDFHGEPDGAREGFAETYEQAESTSAQGTFVAPSPGIHGWFWENQGADVVTIKLTTAGFVSAATEFREDGKKTHTLTQP